ncbi:MAG TPA: sigma-70 family RNA polymerase sigma factor [Blastocatellia bacterium]|nr:sigma-70 family RNA polymerase sigma factor [Blastocatellia bacterium]
MNGLGAKKGLIPIEEMTDQELVMACLANNEVAWEVLIARYERLIYSIAIKLRMSPQEAIEVFQSVCFILLKKLSTLRNQERLYSWLITTTTRECWRIRAVRQRDLVPPQSEGPNGSASSADAPTAEQLALERRIAHEQRQIVWEAISTLPDRCRELIILLFFASEEPSYEDIARRLNMPVSSIGPTRARCLEKLKKILEAKLSKV